ncbi:MAG: hypothetical protein JNG84_03265 [Archangium sp.]|nr:hypothetical protein [Archangium sp.]
MLVLTACGGVRDQFIAGRVQDECDGTWPICNTQVGCVIGDRSYVDGRFPGKNRVIIQLFEPSSVTVSFYLEQVSGAGEETAINFNEDGCRARVRTTVSGRTFVGESQQKGFVSRSADLSGVGDHLIEWESDARANYLAKVDVLPLRLKDNPSGQ